MSPVALHDEYLMALEPPLTYFFTGSPSPRYESFLVCKCSACGQLVEAVGVLCDDPIVCEGL